MTLFAWLLVDETDLAFGAVNHGTGGTLTTPLINNDDKPVFVGFFLQIGGEIAF